MFDNFRFKKNGRVKYPHPYWPVGSIYLSINDINPSKWFGGTWKQIAKGRTLVGVDPNDEDFDQVEKTGGSKFLQKHNHKIGKSGYEGGTSTDALIFKSGLNLVSNYMETNDEGTGNSGNLQPYFTCYMWQRIS